MKEFGSNVAYALLGLSLLVYGCCAMSGGMNVAALVAVLSGAILLIGNSLLAWRALHEKSTVRSESLPPGTGAAIELNISYGILVTRMMSLSEAGVSARVFDGYLSWSFPPIADIRIRKEGDSDWVALFWLNQEPLHAEDAAHGVAVYRKGCLSVLPAELKPAFAAAFMDSIFLPTQKEFSAWLAAYTEKESAESSIER